MAKKEKDFDNSPSFTYKMAYFICSIFSISGFLNTGSSGYYLAIPFIIILILMSFNRGIILGLISIFFLCLLGPTVHNNLIHNSMFFPILSGEISTLQDGYMVKEKESHHYVYYTDKNYEELKKTKDNLTVKAIKKGAYLKAIDLNDSFGKQEELAVETKEGFFIIKVANISPEFSSDHPFENPYTAKLGYLMDYPSTLLEIDPDIEHKFGLK